MKIKYWYWHLSAIGIFKMYLFLHTRLTLPCFQEELQFQLVSIWNLTVRCSQDLFHTYTFYWLVCVISPSPVWWLTLIIHFPKRTFSNHSGATNLSFSKLFHQLEVPDQVSFTTGNFDVRFCVGLCRSDLMQMPPIFYVVRYSVHTTTLTRVFRNEPFSINDTDDIFTQWCVQWSQFNKARLFLCLLA